MKKSILKKCEEKLITMRNDIKKSLKERAAEGLKVETDVQDEGDMAQEVSNKAVSLLLVDKDKNKLTQIEQALIRIKDGNYGICIDSEEEIEESRLLANPLAVRTIEAQEAFERNQKQTAQRKTSGGIFNDD